MSYRDPEVEAARMYYALEQIEDTGLDVDVVSSNELNFEFKGENVKFFPYTGWASGKSIEDGRGIGKLIAQIKKHHESIYCGCGNDLVNVVESETGVCMDCR